MSGTISDKYGPSDSYAHIIILMKHTSQHQSAYTINETKVLPDWSKSNITPPASHHRYSFTTALAHVLPQIKTNELFRLTGE